MADADLRSEFDEAVEERDVPGVIDVARKALKQLSVTQAALDDFMSATATETIRAMKANSKLQEVKIQLDGVCDHARNGNYAKVRDVISDVWGVIHFIEGQDQ